MIMTIPREKDTKIYPEYKLENRLGDQSEMPPGSSEGNGTDPLCPSN